MTRIAINGFGRIGRLLFRRLCEQSDGPMGDVEVVAVNDISSLENSLYVLKYDSVHGRFQGDIRALPDGFEAASRKVRYLSEKELSALPWKDLGIDVVVECTGRLKTREDAAAHLQAGARKVLLSAPMKTADCTLVPGVNDSDYDPDAHDIVNNASCTTNSLAPPLKVLLDNFGIESVLVTTVHAYTISQALIDKATDKRDRGRAAAINIIPSSTGSDVATVQVLPELTGRISATALRVPVADGSISDINAVLGREVTVEEVNEALRHASNNGMKGIMEYSDEELVSSDIIGNPHSSIIHGQSTRVVNGTSIKIQSWYDNEYGYACRLVDTVVRIGKSL